MARDRNDQSDERAGSNPETDRLRGVAPDEDEDFDSADESDEEDLDEEEESTF